MNWERWRLTRAVTISDPFPLIPLSVCWPSIVWQTATVMNRGRWWTCDCWDNGHCDTTERRGDQDWEPRGATRQLHVVLELNRRSLVDSAMDACSICLFSSRGRYSRWSAPFQLTVLTANKLDTNKYIMHQDAPSIWYDSHLHHDLLLFITYSPI